MAYLENLYQMVSDSGYGEIFQVESVRDGFLVGLTIGLILPLGLRLLFWLVCRRRRKSTGIVIHGEHGDLRVSVAAVREFVMRIVSEFHEAALRSVCMKRHGAVEIIEIAVDAVPGTDLVSLQTSLSQRVKEEAARKLGLNVSRGRVNVNVDHYSADESRIARRAKRIIPEKEIGARPEYESGLIVDAAPEDSEELVTSSRLPPLAPSP